MVHVKIHINLMNFTCFLFRLLSQINNNAQFFVKLSFYHQSVGLEEAPLKHIVLKLCTVYMIFYNQTKVLDAVLLSRPVFKN